jgi:hypothetical protein
MIKIFTCFIMVCSLCIAGCAANKTQKSATQDSYKNAKAEEDRRRLESRKIGNQFLKDKNIDTVARILNYSYWGEEEGLHYDMTVATWYPIDKDNCVYSYATNNATKNNQFEPKHSIIELNKIDPREVRIMADGAYSMVFIDGKRRFKTARVDPERLQRGWDLIYSKYCTGIRKEF